MQELERRRHYRVRVPDAYAFCRAAKSEAELRRELDTHWADAVPSPHPHVFRVQNLSVGGVSLDGERRYGLGHGLEVRLFLPGHGFLSLPATVRRAGDVTESPVNLGVQFNRLSDADEEVLAEAVAQMVILECSPVVLVGYPRRHVAQALTRAIEVMGLVPIRVRTPLDAIRRLEDPRLRVSALVLGPSLGDVEARDFAGFLEFHYPNVRRILLARNRWRGLRAMEGRVHAVLQRPWSKTQLEQAMRGSPPAAPRALA